MSFGWILAPNSTESDKNYLALLNVAVLRYLFNMFFGLSVHTNASLVGKSVSVKGEAPDAIDYQSPGPFFTLSIA